MAGPRRLPLTPAMARRRMMKLTLTDETMQSELRELSTKDLLKLAEAVDGEQLRRLKGARQQRFDETLRVPEGDRISDKFETARDRAIDYSGENH